MSAAKPFVFAVVCQALGPDESRRLLGVNATGMPFNSLTAVERSTDGRTNPMVNAGAIASTSLVPGGHVEEKWFLIDRLSRFAGRPLLLDEEVYASASSTNHRNRGIANLLESYGRVYCDPSSATDLYTQSCVAVTATDLATMGATLADGGVNLKTKERVVDAAICHYTLAVMTTAGMYENSGDWLYDVGAPGKSGMGGGIVAVSPGKGGIGTLRHHSTLRGTAFVASSRPASYRAGWSQPVRVGTRGIGADTNCAAGAAQLDDADLEQFAALNADSAVMEHFPRCCRERTATPWPDASTHS